MATITEIAPIASAAFSLITTIVVVFFGRRTAQQIEKIKTIKDTLNIKLEKLQNALEQSRMPIDLSDTKMIFPQIQKQYNNTRNRFGVVKHFIGMNNFERAQKLETEINHVYISQANEKLGGKKPTPVDAQQLSNQMTDYHNLVSAILTEEIRGILAKLES